MLQPIMVYDEKQPFGILYPGAVITIAVIAILIMATLYVLRSIGLYTLSKKMKIKLAWFSWVPCLWIYPLCKLVGNSRFFNTTIDRLALTFTIIFSVISISGFLCDFFRFFPFVMAYLQGGPLGIWILPDGFGIDVLEGAYQFVNYFDTPFINKLVIVLDYVSAFGSILELVIVISIFFPFFKKFWPQHYILASMLSFFGLFGIFAFVVRKKQAVNFNEYMRSRYYGNYGNPYGNQYNNQGPNGFNNGQNYYSRPSNDSPFSEFEEKNAEDPFAEFSSNKKEDEDNL